MDLVRAEQIAENTLEVIHPLVNGKARTTAPFENVVLGTLRRDYLTLYTIVHLSDAKEEERAAFGDSCMDLARRVFEDLISVEYIKLKGKEKYSKQFIAYKAAEAYQDLQYLEASGLEMDAKFVKDTKDEFEKLPRKLKERKRWIGLGVEDMVKTLLDKGVIKPDEFRTLSQTYIAGNYKNHFSPTDIFNFLHNDLYQHAGNSDLLLSMIVVASSVTKLAGTLLEEYGEQGEIKRQVEELWKILTEAHLEQH